MAKPDKATRIDDEGSGTGVKLSNVVPEIGTLPLLAVNPNPR